MKTSLLTSIAQESLLKSAGISLIEDEKMVVAATIHDAIYWKGVAVIILGMFMLIGIFQNLGFLLMFVGIVMVGLSYLAQQYTVLAATDKRVFVRSGYVYTDMIELRYSQIESVELGITPIGQVFGYGSVILSGTGQRRIIVPFIKDALGFRRRVNEILVNK